MTATVPSAGGAGALSAAEIDAKHYASISNLSDGGPSKRVCVKAWANESFKACNLIHSLLPQEAKEKHPPPKMEAFHGAQWLDRVVNDEACAKSGVLRRLQSNVLGRCKTNHGVLRVGEWPA